MAIILLNMHYFTAKGDKKARRWATAPGLGEIKTRPPSTPELLDDDIEALIEERQAARKAKNFARADEIRDLLADKGIILEDTRAGVKWKRA